MSKEKDEVSNLFMINRRRELIKQKGFAIQIADDNRDTMDFNPFEPVDFSKIKVGARTLDDAILNLGELKRVDRRLADKDTVLTAINNCNYEEMREISNFFYKVSGIYGRLCRYMAYLYRYD